MLGGNFPVRLVMGACLGWAGGGTGWYVGVEVLEKWQEKCLEEAIEGLISSFVE